LIYIYLINKWTVLHNCEQPDDNWYAQGYNGGLNIKGGTGMAHELWVKHRAEAGVDAESALQATPLQQIAVSEVARK
jgi:hypothetical protein